jgi:multiple sugar transport system permease protein
MITCRKTANFITTAIIVVILSAVAIMMIFPYLWMISASFKRGKDLFTENIQLIPPVWKPENYTTVIIDEKLLGGFVNTARIFVVVLPVGLFTTSLAAFTFAKMRFRGSKIMFSLLISTMMIPFPVVMMPQYLFFSILNMRDSYLPLIIPGCLGNISAMFFMMQFLKTMPNSLIESAKVEGASYFRIYAQIVLPLIKGAVATQAIFWFMAIWNDLLGPIIYLDSVERYPLTPLLASLNTLNNTMNSLPVIMAGSVLASLPLIVIYIIFQKQIINSLSFTGGIKD